LLRVVEYIDPRGTSPYARWFSSLNEAAAPKVAAALHRLLEGNLSNVRAVGAGVSERKIDFGPGYRLYFGRDGDSLVVLLGGSTKQRQSDAIAAAIARWADYWRRRK
jgi:putative addiction module killer protein